MFFGRTSSKEEDLCMKGKHNENGVFITLFEIFVILKFTCREEVR